jgi:hypothetical protein
MDRVKMALSRLPLSFGASVDRAGRATGFLARGTGYAFSLDRAGAVVQLGIPDSPGAKFSMKLEGGNPSPTLTGEKRLAAVSHYFIGSDPRLWRTGVPQCAKARIVDAYPGIDLVYYGNQRELEFDLVIEPGADPSRIVLAFDGARKLEIEGLAAPRHDGFRCASPGSASPPCGPLAVCAAQEARPWMGPSTLALGRGHGWPRRSVCLLRRRRTEKYQDDARVHRDAEGICQITVQGASGLLKVTTTVTLTVN